MALPTWPGASSCYSRAYHLLEEMASDRKRYYEMQHLIEALNNGDEEAIKAALLYPDYSKP